MIEDNADLLGRRRAAVHAWTAFVEHGDGAERLVRPEIYSSWTRSGASITTDVTHAPLTDEEETRAYWQGSPLQVAVSRVEDDLRRTAEDGDLVLAVTDRDTRVLWTYGGRVMRRKAESVNFVPGARWDDESVGTNALDLANRLSRPAMVFSAEHYEQGQHPWYCTAMPIHDPRTGELLGVVDVSGPALTLHPAIGALVESSVRLAEAGLWRHHEGRLERLRRSAEPVLAGVSGPLLVVDDHGWVAHHAGIAARDRIQAPREHHALAVPGLGLCLPERLGDGWLVRPRGGSGSVSARLDRTGEPALDVTSDEESWRTALTPRHAELLVLIARAGRAGTTAQQLSTAVYGDAEHAVTVRAEVSRLRRAIGALVATNPYRLADGVSLTLVG